MDDVDNFYPRKEKKDTSPENPKNPKTSKRKKNSENSEDSKDPKDRESVKKQCRYYCSTPEEWRTVGKYSLQRQKDYIEEKKFIEQKNLSETVVSATHSLFAVVVDKIGQSDSYIENEINNDLTLRHAIDKEFSELIYIFNNKIRILFLTCVNIFNGKRKQIRERAPQPTIVISEDANPRENNSQEEALENNNSLFRNCE